MKILRSLTRDCKRLERQQRGDGEMHGSTTLCVIQNDIHELVVPTQHARHAPACVELDCTCTLLVRTQSI